MEEIKQQQPVVRDIYCALCAKATPHIGEQDGNGELVFYCTAVKVPRSEKDLTEVYHTFVKFPAVETIAELEAMVADRETVNKDTIETVRAHQKQKIILEQFLKGGQKATITSETPVDQSTQTS